MITPPFSEFPRDAPPLVVRPQSISMIDFITEEGRWLPPDPSDEPSLFDQITSDEIAGFALEFGDSIDPDSDATKAEYHND